MSNSNFTLGNPALVSSVPSPPASPAEGGREGGGTDRRGDVWMRGAGGRVEGIPRKPKGKKRDERSGRRPFGVTHGCFALPCSLPCGPPGGMACCS